MPSRSRVTTLAPVSDRSTYLFAIPRPWEGFGRLVDLGGNFDQYNTMPTDELADANAIWQDWAAVGEDLWAAVNAWSRSRPTP